MSIRRTTIASLGLLLMTGAAAQDDDPWAEDGWGDDPWAETDRGLVWTGFVEGALGQRLHSFGPTDRTLSEGRARLETDHYWKGIDFSLKGDLGYDKVTDEEIAELRELALGFGLGDSIDVKAGRQILTWGTGDLLFLNDLFPKDFVSFFTGRDDEYLKAPGDAVKLSGYTSWFNIDVVWTPEFDPDEYINGERLSFFSAEAGEIVSPDSPIHADRPRDDEFALRLFNNVGGTEFAFYGYDGHFKQPTAVRPDGGLTFAPLRAYGASMRTDFGPGLVNVEVSWHDSRDDDGGDDPRIPNSQFLALAGYEWEPITNLEVGLQYYLEWTQDHDELMAHSATPRFEPDERRQVLTNRLTYRAMRDQLTLSLFTFYSFTDDDAHVRPYLNYRYNDDWQISMGANLFTGRDDHTFFGQLEDNSNVYTRLRWYF